VQHSSARPLLPSQPQLAAGCSSRSYVIRSDTAAGCSTSLAMVWNSWGLLLLLLAAVAAPLSFCSGDVALISFSTTPRRVSRSASAAFAFRVVRAGSGDCVITCQLDGGERERRPSNNCGGGSASASAAGNRGGVGNGTETASYAGLKDGNHTFTVCASSSTTCATYAWNVDTVRPTASVSVEESEFTSASNVTALISFTEPCAGDGGFVCNHSYCHLIVYGPGAVVPSSLQVLSPGLRYSLTVAIAPADEQYGRLILVMARGFCTDAAGHRFVRTPNSTFTLHFDRRTDSMGITATVPEKMLQIQGVTRMVQATNDAIRVYLSFAQPVLNSSAQILSALTATGGAVLTPTNRSTLGNRRFGYLVNKISSDTAIVTVECDAASIISRQGTPVHSAEPLTFLYDTQRPSVKLGTSTWRTSSRFIPVFIKFAKPVFNFSASAVQVAGGNVFHEASKSIYTLQIEAVDRLVSVQVAENAAQDVAGNPNLASDPLQVRHYSVPASSSLAAAITTIIFVVTAIVATLLTVSTSSLLASGAISRPSSYMISEPSRNILRMACHIQIFALARWLSVNLPIEYYEFAKGIEWSIPYMRLPWEGPAADPFLGYYSTMPAIAFSELLDRSAVADEAVIPSDPALPTEFPGDGKPKLPMQTDHPGSGDGNKPVLPVQIPLDGKPLTAMEYRSFFENPDMKPEAQIIMKLQDLDGWKYFGRNMLWAGVMGGGLILLHLLALLYLKRRWYRHSMEQHGYGYGALALPRLEMMVVILALPCVSQAAAALIRGGSGTTGGVVAGVLLTAVLTSLLVGLLLFLSLGITMGRLLQYEEELGQWTWKDPRRAACLPKLGLGPLFEDLRGPPRYTQIATGGSRGDGGKRAGGGGGERKVLGVLRIYYTLLEWVKRVAVGMVAGAHASGGRSSSSRAHAAVVLCIAAFQLLSLLLTKPFIKKRVQVVEILSVGSEVLVLAACLCQALVDKSGVGVAMLGAFALGLAAQVCNEWNALYRQARLLSADRSSFLDGTKTACLGLLLLLLPSSAVLGDRVAVAVADQQQQQPPPPPPADSGRGERWWLGQLREMAKASFSGKDGDGDGGGQ
ncbi:hypothetical protein U9M48_045067, partial [Paspalum notatum var. saurae]